MTHSENIFVYKLPDLNRCIVYPFLGVYPISDNMPSIGG